MAGSQLVTTSEAVDGKVTVTTKDATIGDIFTSAISTNQAVTGIYGLGQKLGFVAIGMAVHSYRKSGTPNFLA